MKLIDVLSEAREDVLIQKGKNVYEFLKHGTFKMRYHKGDLDLTYKYILPNVFGVRVKTGGERDHNGNILGDRPVIDIPVNKDESWVDPKYAVLLEPMDEISKKILINDSDSVAANLRSHLENYVFLPHRVVFNCSRVLLKMELEGRVDLVHTFKREHTKEVFERLKEGTINTTIDSKNISFTYKIPDEDVSFAPTDILVSRGVLKYNAPKDSYLGTETIHKLISNEFKKEGVHLMFSRYVR